jgi:preprotein translocase subunit Sec61beta|tara:strand:- start:228 stop:473 length:246 start_codon:yes stop_codon:yes gene_type:complete
MAKEKKSQGFQSAAGLIRYFDAEDSNAIQISKWAVIMTCILTMMVVEISEAVGRETGAYVLAIGGVIIIINEIRSRRSDTV